MAPTQSEHEKSLPTDELSGHSIKQANSDTEEDNVDLKIAEASIAISDDYPHGFRLTAIVISLMLGTFLVALDNVSRTV
jgi:MFS transporter, DHA2 family, glioxin efflux transporter